MSEKRLEFTLELVTPAFIAGARARATQTKSGKPTFHRLIGPDGDGLRVPSLRGLLRFWFRAKEGLPLGRLSAKEARIFGSTEHGQGVRIIPGESPPWLPKVIETSAGSAKSYLGYGPLNYVKEEGRVSSHHGFGFRDAIPEGTRFGFLALGSECQIQELKKCLALLHLFGGIGGRSRRGWGSLRVECKDLSFDPIGEIGPWIEKILASSVWPFESPRPSALVATPAYSAFWQGSQIRCLNGDYAKPDEVLEAFFEQFRRYRLYDRKNRDSSPALAKADHDVEWETATKGTLSGVPQRIAFGFPYNVHFKGAGVEYTASMPSGNEMVPIHRRASPLLLKVIKLGPNRFGGVALFFNNPFFRSAATAISAKVDGRAVSGNLPPPGASVVSGYLNQPAWLPVVVP